MKAERGTSLIGCQIIPNEKDILTVLNNGSCKALVKIAGN
jgi:hypothetical protein